MKPIDPLITTKDVGDDHVPVPDTAVQSAAEQENASIPAWVSPAVLFIVVAAAIGPMALMGIPDGFDLMQHMRFAASYQTALLNWDLSPAWAANDNFGFGSIGIRYYPPLAYYVLALTKIATGSWYDSFWITSFGWMLLGSIGVFLWIKETIGKLQATAAAVIYVVAPYHLFQIYQALLYAEFAAAGILPFCFLFLSRICRRSRWLDVLLFTAAYSSLILTHIPSTIIASVCLAMYGLLILDQKRLVGTIIKIVSGLALSVLASGFHLAKAIPELEWVMHNTPHYFANGYYDYQRYFFPVYFSSTSARYVEKLLWNIDLLVLLTMLLFLPSVVSWLARTKSPTLPQKQEGRRIEFAMLAAGATAIFMLTIASSGIWHRVSILQKVQFPWRWLLVASLMGSVIFAAAVSRLISLGNGAKRSLIYPAISIVLVLVLIDVTQSIILSSPLSREVFDQKVANMYDEEGCDCWWPVWGRREAFDKRTQVDAGERDVMIQRWQDTSREFSIGGGQAEKIRVATFFHPYWKALLNGTIVSVEPDDNGAILISTPQEPAYVRLYFDEPWYLYAARLISLFTWLGIGGLLILSYYFTARRAGHSPV